MDAPDTRYAWNGELALAYQVVGQGPVDVLYVPNFTSNVDWNWESPSYRHMLNRLASFARLIVYDRRGWGLLGPALARAQAYRVGGRSRMVPVVVAAAHVRRNRRGTRRP